MIKRTAIRDYNCENNGCTVKIKAGDIHYTVDKFNTPRLRICLMCAKRKQK
jgi:hypothetical protein